MRGAPGRPLVLPDPLCDYQAAPPPDWLGDHVQRLIVLAEQEDVHDEPPHGILSAGWERTTMLTFREMKLLGFVKNRPTGYEYSHLPVLTAAPGVGETDIDLYLHAHAAAPDAVKHHRCRYRTLATMFHDPINYLVKFGAREIGTGGRIRWVIGITSVLLPWLKEHMPSCGILVTLLTTYWWSPAHWR